MSDELTKELWLATRKPAKKVETWLRNNGAKQITATQALHTPAFYYVPLDFIIDKLTEAEKFVNFFYIENARSTATSNEQVITLQRGPAMYSYALADELWNPEYIPRSRREYTLRGSFFIPDTIPAEELEKIAK